MTFAHLLNPPTIQPTGGRVHRMEPSTTEPRPPQRSVGRPITLDRAADRLLALGRLKSDGPLASPELARRLDFSSPRMKLALGKLAKDGLVIYVRVVSGAGGGVWTAV